MTPKSVQAQASAAYHRVDAAIQQTSSSVVTFVSQKTGKDVEAYRPQVAIALKVVAIAAAALAIFTAYAHPFFFLAATAAGLAIRLSDRTATDLTDVLVKSIKQEKILTLIGLSATAALVVSVSASLALLSVATGVTLGASLRSLAQKV